MLRDRVKISDALLLVLRGEPTRRFSLPGGNAAGTTPPTLIDEDEAAKRGDGQGEGPWATATTDDCSSLITLPSIKPCCKSRRDFISTLSSMGFSYKLIYVFYNASQTKDHTIKNTIKETSHVCLSVSLENQISYQRKRCVVLF